MIKIIILNNNTHEGRFIILGIELFKTFGLGFGIITGKYLNSASVGCIVYEIESEYC